MPGLVWFFLCVLPVPGFAQPGSVVAWGTNSYGQLDVPAGVITNAIQVAAGWDHSLALLADGTIVGWGRNDHLQTEVPADVTNVLRVAAGPGDSFAIGQDAKLTGWGAASYGMFTNRLDLSDIKMVSEGWDYKMVLKTDGTVLSWGQPNYGSTNISKTLRDIIAVAAGGSHGVALRANGTIAAWGDNYYGQTNIPKNLTNVIAIAAGQEHSVALRGDGTVVAWGRNLYGMTNVPAGLTNVVAIAAGFRHTMALVSDGTVVAWGKNDGGQSSVPLGLSNVCSIAAGGDTFSGFSLAALSDGSPRMTIQPSDLTVDAGSGFRLQARAVGTASLYYQWRVGGQEIAGATNCFFAIDYSNTSDSGAYEVVVENSLGSVTSLVAQVAIRPSDVVAWGENTQRQTVVPVDLTNAISIAAGVYHTLAVRPDGTVAAWGSYSSGESSVPPALTDCISVAAGLWHSLALKSDGTVVSWGKAPLIPSSATNLISIAAGDSYCLGLKADGTLLAWGNSPFCQCTNVPVGSNFVAISAHSDSGMALMSDGTISAWGVNCPRPPPGTSNVIAIALGDSHALALKADGTVQGWGDNRWGQLRFPPGLTNVVAITAGWEYSLALKDDGTVVGWGSGNSSGPVAVVTNLPPDLANVVQLATGMFHNVAVRGDGSPHFTVQPWSRTISTRDVMTLCAKAVGAQPMSYQWQFNGQDILGATTDSLTLTSPAPSASGSYHLVVSNAHGTNVSSEALVSVLATPPMFTRQPTDQSVGAGDNVIFAVEVAGALPISYQWQFNGVYLVDATNASLLLTNVQPASQGIYSVIAKNLDGTVTSSNALLLVFDLAGALDTTNLVWTTTGSQLWYPETSISHDGIAAAACGPVSYGQQASLQTTISGPGTLSFWWQASSTVSYSGVFNFSVDGIKNVGIGTPLYPIWQNQIVYLPPGDHLLQWTSSENSPLSSRPTVTGWLDEVSYVPGPTQANVLIPPASQTVPAGTNVSIAVYGGGTPPLRYQWQFNGQDIPARFGNLLTLTNVQSANSGIYTAIITNEYGSVKVDASLTVDAAPPVIWVQPVNREAVLAAACEFDVAARGSEPLFYQWLFNGNPIAGATSSSLVINSIQASSIGSYSVAITNAYGSIMSSNASITLVPSLLIAWGDNFFGQCDVPWSMTNISVFSGGYACTSAANSNDVETHWGFPIPSFSPAPKDLTAISAGAWFILGLESNGTVVATGTTLPQDLTNVAAISAGYDNSLALRTDGSIVAWGSNTFGQTNVPAGLSNVIAVACGRNHNMVLTQDGVVVAWGDDSFGQARIPAGLSNVVAIAAGWYHSLALRSDGVVVAWGKNMLGETNVPVSLSNVVSIAAGIDHSLALVNDGTVVAWGSNASGQTSVPSAVTNVVEISSGERHCIVLVGSGAPHSIRPPLNQTANAGATVTLNAGIVGAQPISYQWQHDGTNILGATAAFLTLTNLSQINAGEYRCLGSNVLGSITTAQTTLSVNRSSPRFDTSAGALQMTDAGLLLRLEGLSGHGVIVLLGSTNLRDWQPIFTNPPCAGSVQLLDPNNRPSKFYRAVEQ